jgi:hypothetical protein
MQVTVEFMGGPWDGRASFQFPLQGRDHADHILNAAGFYVLTKGKVGVATHNMSPAHMQQLVEYGPEVFLARPKSECIYRVVDRGERDGQVFIRAAYHPSQNGH